MNRRMSVCLSIRPRLSARMSVCLSRSWSVSQFALQRYLWSRVALLSLFVRYADWNHNPFSTKTDTRPFSFSVWNPHRVEFPDQATILSSTLPHFNLGSRNVLSTIFLFPWLESSDNKLINQAIFYSNLDFNYYILFFLRFRARSSRGEAYRWHLQGTQVPETGSTSGRWEGGNRSRLRTHTYADH